jgi:hypothetical protein
MDGTNAITTATGMSHMQTPPNGSLGGEEAEELEVDELDNSPNSRKESDTKERRAEV